MTQADKCNIRNVSVLSVHPAMSAISQTEQPWHEQLCLNSPIGRRHRFAYRILGKLYAFFFRAD